MNCRRTQGLIPLFVEDDLDSGPAKLVSDHLKSCEVCRTHVDGFRQSQGWLKSYVPREFDAAYFESIESRVRASMDETGKASSWDRIRGRLWSVHLPIAVGAMLVVATGITFLFLRSGVEDRLPSDRPVAQGGANKNPEVPNSGVTKGAPTGGTAVPADLPPPKRSGRPSGRVTHEPQHGGPEGAPEVAIQSDASNPLSSGFEETRDLAGDYEQPVQLTIYIQTNDPNVRIIWLVPKPDDGE